MNYFTDTQTKCVIEVLKTQIALQGDVFNGEKYNGLAAKKSEENPNLWYIEAILTSIENFGGRTMDFEQFCEENNIKIDYSKCLL